jgi:hypothetical protein
MNYLTLNGLWAIDEIKVHILNDKLAWIDYRKYEVNAERHIDVVHVGFIERRKGVTLEEKINKQMVKLKDKLEKDNDKIRKYKALEQKFN